MAASKPKPARAAWWPLFALAVPVSSLLGLAANIREDGLGFVADVWAASILADLVFVLGTVGAVWLTAWLALKPGRPRGRRMLAAAGLGFVLHYLVYLASWTLVAGRFGHAEPFGESALLVLRGGLLGLALMAFYGPLVALYLPRGGAPGGAPVIPQPPPGGAA